MIAQRILAVIAALFLVLAAALVILGPQGQPLGQLLYTLDRGLLNMMQAGVQRHLSPWIWDHIFVPVLVRPAWLLPGGIGILTAGAALTLSSRRATQASRRRRL